MAASSPVCETELCSFQDSSADLKGLDSQVIAISNDGPFANKAFAEKNNISFPVLGDYTSNTIKDYGVLMPDLLHIKNYNAVQILSQEFAYKNCSIQTTTREWWDNIL